MAFSIKAPALLVTLGLMTPFSLFAQSAQRSARDVLKKSTADQIAVLESALDQGLPEDRADEVTMLVINRSDIAVPILLRRVQDALSSGPTRSERFVNLAVEFIAYAGDDEAVRAVARLISLDEERFGPYIERTLDNAVNWRNPFPLVYRVLEMTDSRVTGLAMRWVGATTHSSARQRQWAEAMLDRYGKVPASSDWSKDPIAARLKPESRSLLRDRVLALSSELQRRRNQ